MLKLAICYMKFYKSQTFAILASVALTAALLSGVSSLLYSGQKNQLQNSKALYGEWHYFIEADEAFTQERISHESREGFRLQRIGKKQIRDIITSPYRIYFSETNEEYRELSHRQITEGVYPNGESEIAADRYTLGNLGFFGKVGDTLRLNGKSYKLTGIIKSAWAPDADEMEIFVGKDFAGTCRRTLFYVQFDEGKKLYRQLEAFEKEYQISSDAVTPNEKVVNGLGGERPDRIFDIFKFALTNEDGNFTYVLLKLQSEYNLALYGMIFLLCVFSLFVVYSIFSISASKRIAEYGMMQTLGISERRIGETLLLELWLLFLLGYPLGCLLGSGALSLCYKRLSGIFESTGLIYDGAGSLGAGQAELERAPDAGFFVSWDAIAFGFVFLFVALMLVTYFTVIGMRKKTVRQAMAGDVSFIKRRKIYSYQAYSLAPVVVKKFMFSNKKKTLGILLSLSIGGCMFLCATYMAENLKIHAEMSMQSDDGLGYAYRIFVRSNTATDAVPDILSDRISQAVVDKVKRIPGLEQAFATKYTLSELTVQKQDLEWESYFDEANKDPYYKERFGGICVEKKDGSYGIKYNVYGYNAGMIKQLSDYVLEGEIDPADLEKGNRVIAVANMDGQGNYNFYGKHPGDVVTLKALAGGNGLRDLEKAMKFQGAGSDYVEKEFEIAAIVSRPLAQESGCLNVNSWRNAQSFIFTNAQMERYFGITDYSIINASPAKGADTDAVIGELFAAIGDVPKAVLQDYGQAIKTQKSYLRKQQAFVSGIAAILLIISLFHIMNSMDYTILSRTREYGILRAMGITDAGIYRMILQTGLRYGLLADLTVFLAYHLVFRRIMDYYMAHVLQFLHFTAAVPSGIMAAVMLLNVGIAMAAVFVPAGKLVRADIIKEIARET